AAAPTTDLAERAAGLGAAVAEGPLTGAVGAHAGRVGAAATGSPRGDAITPDTTAARVAGVGGAAVLAGPSAGGARRPAGPRRAAHPPPAGAPAGAVAGPTL